MTTLFGILETGARALFSQQIGLSVTGHNMANASTEGFSRQRVNFAATAPLTTTLGALPTGVEVQSVTRLRDRFLDFQIRTQSSRQGFLNENEDIFGQLQIILQDPLNPIAETLEESPEEAGLNSLLQRFFGAFQELASSPESSAVRATVRETAITLASGLNVMSGALEDYQDGLNQQVGIAVDQINSLLDRIAELNQEVVKIELNPGVVANDARDLRDRMLTELSEWVPISVTEESDGSVNVQVMTSSVVIGNRTAPFEAVSFPGDTTGTLQIINSIERSRVLTGDFTTGKLAALIQARDQLVPDILSQLDEVARIVIEEVNDIHSESIGLIAFSSLTSANSVSDSAVALDSMGLDFPAEAGDFVIRVVDGNGVVQNLYTVSFDPSVDSLNDLAARIDAIDGAAGAGAGAISAVVTSDNRLEITSNGGLEFTFQGDTSKVLAALGMNTFFAGNDAGSIAVSDFILDPDDGLARIAASATGAEGDNGSALAIASLENDLIADGDTVTIGDFYRRIVSELGVEAQRNKTLAGNMDAIVLDLKNRQEAVAGVSLDEESVNLIKFQQAYNAAARYISTIDALLDRVINGMGVIT